MSTQGKRYRSRARDAVPVNNSPASQAYYASQSAARGGPPMPERLQEELERVQGRLAAGEPLDKVLARPPHRPKDAGFTSDDIVAAFVALRARELGGGEDALVQAKKDAVTAFIDLPYDEDNAARTVRRAWKNAGHTIGSLDTATLEEILAPMEVRSPPHGGT